MFANLLSSIMLAGTVGVGSIKSAPTFNNEKTPKTTIAEVSKTYNYINSYYNIESKTTTTGGVITEDFTKHYTNWNANIANNQINYNSSAYTQLPIRSIKNQNQNTYTITAESASTVTFLNIHHYESLTYSNYDLTYNYRFSAMTTGQTQYTIAIHIYKYIDYNNVNKYIGLGNAQTIFTYMDYEESTYTGETKITDEANILDSYEDTITLQYGQVTEYELDLTEYIESTVNQGYAIEIVMEEDLQLTNIDQKAHTQDIAMYSSNNYFQPYQLNAAYTYTAITYEVINIPDIMFTILTMPFTFISMCFNNLTLFPNTPYQVNIGNIVFTLLAVVIIIWIIKKILAK